MPLEMKDKGYTKGAYVALPDIRYRDTINELIKPFAAHRLMYTMSKQQLRDLLAATMLIMHVNLDPEMQASPPEAEEEVGLKDDVEAEIIRNSDGSGHPI